MEIYYERSNFASYVGKILRHYESVKPLVDSEIEYINKINKERLETFKMCLPKDVKGSPVTKDMVVEYLSGLNFVNFSEFNNNRVNIQLSFTDTEHFKDYVTYKDYESFYSFNRKYLDKACYFGIHLNLLRSDCDVKIKTLKKMLKLSTYVDKVSLSHKDQQWLYDVSQNVPEFSKD